MRKTLLSIAVASALLAACAQDTRTTGPDADDAVVPVAIEPVPMPVPVEAEAPVVFDEASPAAASELDTAVVTGSRVGGLRDEQRQREAFAAQAPAKVTTEAQALGYAAPASAPPPGLAFRMAPPMPVVERNTENYESLPSNPVMRVAESPVSTFSIDVDTGSYTNVRSLLAQGQRPPADAVRAEEMINYFDYGYPGPASRDTPFRVSTEVAPAPWNAQRLLLQVGIQGYQVPPRNIPAANLVFLIDTSGSMADADKLPLLKECFRQMVETLREQDRVSIVVYAGSAGLVLPPTSGADKEALLGALDRLEAGGSTNGGAGLQLAYAMAKQARIEGGVNRVILATDGDFNVGTFDQKSLETAIADERKSGIALTTLGFGRGNYNDAMAERLADAGNGNHAYVDSVAEGRRVLVDEMSSTLLTIAQDVKIQLEFNPAVVAEYRLIGYENRALRREDFNNDRVDAGEIGAGHDVTALYEIALVGSGGERSDPLRYGAANAERAGRDAELGLLRLRYKLPGAERSRLIEAPLARDAIRAEPSERLRFASAVAAYADLLRGGTNVGHFGWGQVQALAAGSLGADPGGRRREFLRLVDQARAITGDEPAVAVSE